jgi:hypothetical protein
MRRILLLIGVLFLLFGCAIDLDFDTAPDTRVGELGRVRYTSSGCTGSTAMAVGSRDTIVLEPMQGLLPEDLSVSSQDPGVISASQVGEPSEVLLRAHTEGESMVTVLSAGHLFDFLTFQAVPAEGLSFDAYPTVLAGGSLDVRVIEVYGACGNSDCLLFGHSFLGWRSEPAGALELVLDDLGTAQFIASGSGEVVGREPARGADLLVTEVTVVPHEQIAGLAVTAITIPLEEGEVSEIVTLPGTVRTNQALLLHVDGLREGAEAVPISRRDVRWTVAGTLVQEVAQGHDGAPLGDLFLVGAEAGTVELEATVDLLGTTASFTLTIVEG